MVAEPAETKHMVFCRGCGTQIHESAESCPKCGAVQKIASPAQKGAIIGAYVGAIVLPILGIGIGIYLLVKQKWLHGILSIMISVFMWAF
jgi:hypothetical protein